MSSIMGDFNGWISSVYVCLPFVKFHFRRTQNLNSRIWEFRRSENELMGAKAIIEDARSMASIAMGDINLRAHQASRR